MKEIKLQPPNIIKNIPIAINKRLSELSNNEEVFNNAKKSYQEALKNSGYEHELKYEKPTQETNVNKHTRKDRTKKYCRTTRRFPSTSIYWKLTGDGLVSRLGEDKDFHLHD